MKASLGWVLLLTAVLPSPLAAQEMRTVTATGTGVARAEPDVVVWRITTIGASNQLPQAKAHSDERVKRVLNLLRESGISPDDVRTGYPSMRNRPNSYRIIRTITFKQHGLEQFDELFEKLAEKESEYQQTDFHFESTRMAQLRLDASTLAAKDALQKAAAMSLGVRGKTGYPLAIKERQPKLSGKDVTSSISASGLIEVRVQVDVTLEYKWVGGSGPR